MCMTTGNPQEMMADYRRFARATPSEGSVAAAFSVRFKPRVLQPAWKAHGMAILAVHLGRRIGRRVVGQQRAEAIQCTETHVWSTSAYTIGKLLCQKGTARV